MIARLFSRFKSQVHDLQTSRLYNEKTFYRALERDLNFCQNELVIESPFITGKRVKMLLPVLAKLKARGVKIAINTRHPAQHESYMQDQATKGLDLLQRLGVTILFTGGHHRKLVILDRNILWEGSLNVLSQYDSCEVMRRIESQQLASEMIRFTQINRFLS